MVSLRPDVSVEEIHRGLVECARTLLGEERAGAVSAALEQTARQLWEIGRTQTERDVEPGFYQ